MASAYAWWATARKVRRVGRVKNEHGMCAAITGARYKTTTEVYPDSPRAAPQQCNDAQVAAVCAALDHVLAESSV